MHYFITGHTGFKGSWLTFLLLRMGHEVSGFSLDPEPGSLFSNTSVGRKMAGDFRGDVRNENALLAALSETAPDVVIHMAAQPLVREGYRNPRTTFETNVNGTLNVLTATSQCKSIKAQLIITTDKVYRNKNQRKGYVESDELGGDDPYSASKAMADLLAQSWIKSFPGIPTAIARAGNVIGGGDVCKDRLFPDLISSYKMGKRVKLRYPNAVRPWQHVLDCVNGYLKLSEYLLNGGNETVWNFGPKDDEFISVHKVAELVGGLWNVTPAWEELEDVHHHEASLLALDSTKAREKLLWRERFVFSDAVSITSNWYSQVNKGLSPNEATKNDLELFLSKI